MRLSTSAFVTEGDHVGDVPGPEREHDQAVEAQGDPGGGRHPGQRGQQRLVDRVDRPCRGRRGSRASSSKRRRCSTGSVSSPNALASSRPPA